MQPVKMFSTLSCPYCVHAKALLKKLGFDNARVLAGGTAAWREANLPIEKTA